VDIATRRVFATCMPTPSKSRLSNLSVFSGGVFLFSGFCTPIFESAVLFNICLLSAPVLLIALVIDVCHKRYWAIAPLVLLAAALVLLALALRGFNPVPVGG
jgi:hypothetical protein